MELDYEIVKQTNEVWGYDYMTSLCMEEFAEAIQAINKVKRNINDENIDHLNEEIADCIICIEQLKDLGILDNVKIQDWIKFKQNRQAERNKIKKGE